MPRDCPPGGGRNTTGGTVTAWQAQAACAGKPTKWWYPLSVGNTRAYRMPVAQWRQAGAYALSICAQCPVRQQCKADAVASYDWHGIRGGLTPPEIRDLAGRAPVKAWNSGLSRHGSESKYTHGCRCDLCREAHAAYHRRYRREKAS